MFGLKIIFWLAIILVAGSIIATQIFVRRLEAKYPPIGDFAVIDGVQMHYLDIPAGPDADLEPMIFIHGASGNVRDLYGAFIDELEGRARLIFIDRPGAGYSQTGFDGSAPLDRQVDLIAGLIDHLEIDRAVVAGHSLGGALTAAMAVKYPEKVSGLVFLAPATHVWPGGGVTWYYDITNTPVLGRVFSETLGAPGGRLVMRRGVKGVFKPNKVPSRFFERAAVELVLRPENFRNNASDVGNLYAYVEEMSPRYGEIGAPTVIISGDKDDVVSTQIHSEALNQDIAGSKLVILPDTGHAPAYTATDRIVEEIELLNRRIREMDQDVRNSG
ncbi:MAG: alpha/beta fold hydrolase [Rhizobiaceae bacterium]